MNEFRKFLEEVFSVMLSYDKRESRAIIAISVILLGILSFMEYQNNKNIKINPLYIELPNTIIPDTRLIADSLFYFDPNTVTVENLRKLGFTEKQADAIDNYRKSGAVFRKPEDFGKSFIVSEYMLEKLIPYMVIEDRAIVRNTDTENSPDEFVPVDINGADADELQRIYGIGKVLSRRIITYREKLGGFVFKEQLLEVKGIDEDNFKSISEQFFIDLDKIQKIDINFAPANQLRSHPYITRSMAERIVGSRNIKGGWELLKELTDNDILLPDEAEKIAPYIVFRTEGQ
ncbi:MAG: helix-hairpin-helix domain-containing protein [Rikenellaceae bacterium]|nr:helix-hairpin-helix domain-containing protein [Rikenellaceae bacterium]